MKMVRSVMPLRTLIMIGVDAIALTLAVLLSLFIRSLFDVGVVSFSTYIAAWPGIPLLIILMAIRRLYRTLPWTAHEELRHIFISLTLGFGLLGAGAFLSGQAVIWSRSVLIIAWILSLILVPLCRYLLRLSCSDLRWWPTPCVVLGGGNTGKSVIQRLLKNSWIGLRPVAVYDDDPALKERELYGVPIVGPLSSVASTVRQFKLDTAIVAMPGAPAESLFTLERENIKNFSRIIMIPALMGHSSHDLDVHDLGGVVGISSRRQLLMPIPRLFKRTLDILLIIVLFVPIALLIAVLALIIRLTSRGPIFFRQKRLGIGKREFTVLKFRTMVIDAEEKLKELLDNNPDLKSEYETYHKLKDDPRITTIGKFLRKTSLDELPQFWNVVLGEMSFVGPRAYLVSELEKMGHHVDIILGVRPGITGLWQVGGRNEISFSDRLEMEQHYVRIWSIWLDIVILLKTIIVILGRKGAF